ncbi:FliH/SctL family protein [Desulfoplanes sp.]
MSLSNNDKSFKVGRIFMGLNAKGVDPMAPLQSPVFSPEKEAEYIERVKQKATDAAREIIAGAMNEAEDVKKQAFSEGYDQGMAQANKEIEATRQDLSKTLASVVESFDAEKASLWTSRREEIVLVLKTALEKILATELADNRGTVLEHLLDEALDRIDSRECITLSCAAQDKHLLEDLLARAQANRPDLSKWIVKECVSLHRGGIKVESSYGMVDNSIGSRHDLVKEIIDQIALEDDQ